MKEEEEVISVISFRGICQSLLLVLLGDTTKLGCKLGAHLDDGQVGRAKRSFFHLFGGWFWILLLI
ncbi:hypothetical protein LINGRAHAP2_LOCUS9212 [Linum grandiflorum]